MHCIQIIIIILISGTIQIQIMYNKHNLYYIHKV